MIQQHPLHKPLMRCACTAVSTTQPNKQLVKTITHHVFCLHWPFRPSRPCQTKHRTVGWPRHCLRSPSNGAEWKANRVLMLKPQVHVPLRRTACRSWLGCSSPGSPPPGGTWSSEATQGGCDRGRGLGVGQGGGVEPSTLNLLLLSCMGPDNINYSLESRSGLTRVVATQLRLQMYKCKSLRSSSPV